MSMAWFINTRMDWILVSALTIVTAVTIHFWLRSAHKTGLKPWLLAALACILLVSGYSAERAGQREARTLQTMLEGFAPTYAYEMTEAGHARLPVEASPQDPLYLRLIQIEKDWLKLNRFVNDIYTFRKKDGKIILMVDSETDYDHNGRYEGEREMRTPIGEVYEEADKNLLKAFTGTPAFDGKPYTDRWGTWVSAYAPMFRDDGSVDGVLGVDYAAKEWIWAIARRRAAVLSSFFALALILIVSVSIITILQKEIAERKILQTHLIQSQKMDTVGTLAGGIAHDLNNQLTPLVGYLDLLMKGKMGAEASLKILEEANKSAQRCADVVHRLLSFSQPSLRTKTVLDLKALLDEFTGLLSKVIPSTIDVDVTTEPGLRNVYADASEIHTVLMNLAVNARDAMPSGGRLAISAFNADINADNLTQGLKPGNYIKIRVQDTGSGIPAHWLPRIFEPFFTTKERTRGTGLGLAMVFNIIKDHGGWIGVESEVGKGTTFNIYLPAAEKGPKEKTASDADKSGFLPQGSGSECVLFVDDEESLRAMGRSFLERLNYKVLSAQDGKEALEIYQKKYKEIHAVVLDMTMPKLPGKEVLKQMLAVNPAAKIILSSGYTLEGKPEELMAAGAKFFLAKPYTIRAFAQCLRNVLDAR